MALRRRSHGWVGALLLAGASGLARAAVQETRPVLEAPRPVDAELPERIDGLERLKCAACHETIAEEWAGTVHAMSWVDPRYRAAIAQKRRPEVCYGCHVPIPLFGTALDALLLKPAPRELTEPGDPADFGVSCLSCHLGPDGAMLGPFGIETDAHASLRSERFVGAGSNKLCAACHATTVGPVLGVAKDFEGARLAERGESCVGCHMAPVERPHATDDEDRPAPARAGASHALQSARDPRFLAQAFALEARAVEGGAELALANRAGHRVPGLLTRRLVFRARLVDADGVACGSAELAFDGTGALAVDEERVLSIEANARAVAVEVEASHNAPPGPSGTPDPVVFLRERLALER